MSELLSQVPQLNTYIALAVVLLSLLLLSPVLKGPGKHHLGTLLLIICTMGTLLFFEQITRSEKPSKIKAQVTVEKAESVLKLMCTINVGVARFWEMFGPIHDAKGQTHSPIEVSSSGLSNYFKAAEQSLKDEIKKNPTNADLRGKLVILLHAWGSHKELMRKTCEEMKSSSQDDERRLGEVLWFACISNSTHLDTEILLASNAKTADSSGTPTNDKSVPIESSQNTNASLKFNAQRPQQLNTEKDQLALSKQILESKIASGWYHDNLLLSLYKRLGSKQQYADYSQSLESRYLNSFCTGVALMAIGAFCAFIGVVVIIIQLGTLARKEVVSTEAEPGRLNVSYRTIYAVFVGWMCSQLIIAEALKLLPKNVFSLGANPLGISIFSFISYLLTMLPALLLIYLLALRPQGLNPVNGLLLRFKTERAGPLKLILAGFLSWCAIIPLVVASSAISAVLGGQGSDNPVLPQIALVAGSKNILAISILYLTVAGLAPFCEEIVFRGFLYAGLKPKIGIFPALLVSSFIFAGIHFDKGGILMLLALGPVLAVVFERTRSLIPSMIAHGLWNGGAFAFTLLLFFG